MEHPNIVLGLVGEMGSGKGTAAAYLKERYGAVTMRFSTMLRDVLGRLYLPDDRANMQALSLSLRRDFGEDIMSRVIAEDIRRSPNKIIITDGVRRFEDALHLKALPGFRIVALEADQRTRYERIKKRGENPDDATKTWEQFVAEGNEEPERQIREVMARADLRIDNHGGYEEFYRQIDNIMRELGAAPAVS